MPEECSQLRTAARETERVARIWTVGGIVVLALVIVGVVVFAPDDGSDSSDSAPGATSTTATTGPSPATSVPVTTVAPATTAPATTAPAAAPVPGTCAAEATAIRAAVDAGVAGALDGAEVAECRLAAVDATWAVMRLEAKPGSGFAATTVLLHSSDGTWTIADSGTGEVGCGRAPQQVLVDLGLFCIGAGGSGQ